MVDQQKLKSVLLYDPLTGVFTWRRREGVQRDWNERHALKEAGRVMHRRIPYRQIKIDNKSYYAHRLAWLYVTGSWPVNYIDHRNGDGLDNSWENLREATNQQNQSNSRIAANNTTGFKGVCFSSSAQKYQASIHHKGKPTYLGQYQTPEEAHAVYCAVARKLRGEYARIS